MNEKAIRVRTEGREKVPKWGEKVGHEADLVTSTPKTVLGHWKVTERVLNMGCNIPVKSQGCSAALPIHQWYNPRSRAIRSPLLYRGIHSALEKLSSWCQTARKTLSLGSHPGSLAPVPRWTVLWTGLYWAPLSLRGKWPWKYIPFIFL